MVTHKKGILFLQNAFPFSIRFVNRKNYFRVIFPVASILIGLLGMSCCVSVIISLITALVLSVLGPTPGRWING